MTPIWVSTRWQEKIAPVIEHGLTGSSCTSVLTAAIGGTALRAEDITARPNGDSFVNSLEQLLR